MRRTVFLSILAAGFLAPSAFADDDADFRKAAPQIRLAFFEAFAKQDVARLAGPTPMFGRMDGGKSGWRR